MSSLPSKHLGHIGSKVPAMGLGLMGMSAFYNDSDHKSDEARFKVLNAAHAAGQVLWDTADVYGDRWAPTAFLYRSLWLSLTFDTVKIWWESGLQGPASGYSPFPLYSIMLLH